MLLLYSADPRSAPPERSWPFGPPNFAHTESSGEATLSDVAMPMRDRRRSRGAMSVEYALMLVVVTGAVVGVLGLGLNVGFDKARCVIGAALNGGSCDGGAVSGPVPTTSDPGPGPTGGPTSHGPLPGDSTPPCDASATTSQTESSGSD